MSQKGNVQFINNAMDRFENVVVMEKIIGNMLIILGIELWMV
jgi:hypothetical protein